MLVVFIALDAAFLTGDGQDRSRTRTDEDCSEGMW